MTVPVRRGTGPKARLLAFLEAFDAYVKAKYEADEGETSIERLELRDAMLRARKEVRGTMGLY